MLYVIILSTVMLYVIMLSDVMLSQSAAFCVRLNFIMHSVVMLNVIMLNVVAPFEGLFLKHYDWAKEAGSDKYTRLQYWSINYKCKKF